MGCSQSVLLPYIWYTVLHSGQRSVRVSMAWGAGVAVSVGVGGYIRGRPSVSIMRNLQQRYTDLGMIKGIDFLHLGGQ